MDISELFIDGCRLPNPLSKQEVYELLEKIKQGDTKSFEILVEHNIRLVIFEVTRRFKNVKYDKKDLVSIGNIGLMKAIETFDISKGVEFSVYAIKCIDNEILMFLRSLKKDEKVSSFNTIIGYDKDDNEFELKDVLCDDIDVEEEYINSELYDVIRDIVKELPEREGKVITLYFGFYNDEIFNQQQIADILSISQPHVYRLKTKALKLICQELVKRGLIEFRRGKMTLCENKFKDGDNDMARNLQTIYQYFDSYTKEEVDVMLDKLSDDDKALITLRYGVDLNNPIVGSLSKKERDRFYGILIPKMKKILENPNMEIISRKKRKIDVNVTTNTLIDQLQLITSVDRQLMTVNSITKEDYNKMLELLRMPSFTKMFVGCSSKEVMVVLLKLGYVDGKCFSALAISEFLGIEQQEVIAITKKVLLLYKAKVNNVIDSAIKNVAEEYEEPFIPSIKSLIR